MSRGKTIKRPMVYVRRVNLFRREIHERLSPTALDLFLVHAKRISEGKLSQKGRYFGSTMLTLDLALVQEKLGGLDEPKIAERLVSALQQEPNFFAQVRAVVLREAERIACQTLFAVETDVKIKAEDLQIFVDVDVEGEVRCQKLSGDGRS